MIFNYMTFPQRMLKSTLLKIYNLESTEILGNGDVYSPSPRL